MKEITPFNLELKLDAESRKKESDLRKSPKPKNSTGIISVDITSKKLGLLKNLSNGNFVGQKDKSPKKVSFKKGNSMAMLKEAIKAKQQSAASLEGAKLPPGEQAATADPMIHI